ncbi:MAG: 2Fe-2S iron-sulfur cluster-binding protein, partial [Defluviicoccus sp.]|nr:2Fe-2S iron-sulfur cluster-binding protein [Defluviicoccus sp.]
PPPPPRPPRPPPPPPPPPEAGLPWRWYCGGEALCGTCCVLVVEGALDEPNEVERYFIEGWGYHPSFRLACQARVVEPVAVISCAEEGYDRDAVLAAYESAVSERSKREA